jgi:flagellar biosynthetic protein FliP
MRRLRLLLPWIPTAAVLYPLPALAEEAPSPAREAGSWLDALTDLEPDKIGVAVRALVVVTVLGVVPSVLLLTTCFPRVVIVLSFLRRAIGAQDLPPNLVVVGFSLLLTVLVMLPVWTQVYNTAYVPLVERKEIGPEEAFRRAEEPLKRFLLSHTLQSDLRLVVSMSEAGGGSAAGTTDLRRVDDLHLGVILPAFVLSELRTAFQIGFLLFLPFLVIDLVVSAVLVSTGMFLLPPTLVSLPLKVLVFVLVDGWSLVVSQLVQSLQEVS